MRPWDEWIDELLRASADLDLRAGVADGIAIPRFVAGHGERPLLFAEIRPFPPGGYPEPLIELMSLAVPLGADRVAVGMTARLSSLRDPVPPVIPGVGDLRQRVLSIVHVDAHRQPASTRTTLVPFSLGADAPAWDEPLDLGPGEGWIPAALAVLLDHRDEVTAGPKQLRAQAERCLALGHALALEDAVAELLAMETEPLR